MPTPRTYRLPRLESPQEAVLRTWVQVVRTFYRMQRQLEQVLDRQGLSLPQFDVLATLATGEGITQQELAERLLVTKGNICGILDRLEKLLLVERRPDAVDRRANRIYLTAGGRKKLAAALPCHHDVLEQMTRSLSPEELAALRSVMEKLEAGQSDR